MFAEWQGTPLTLPSFSQVFATVLGNQVGTLYEAQASMENHGNAQATPLSIRAMISSIAK